MWKVLPVAFCFLLLRDTYILKVYLRKSFNIHHELWKTSHYSCICTKTIIISNSDPFPILHEIALRQWMVRETPSNYMARWKWWAFCILIARYFIHWETIIIKIIKLKISIYLSSSKSSLCLCCIHVRSIHTQIILFTFLHPIM